MDALPVGELPGRECGGWSPRKDGCVDYRRGTEACDPSGVFFPRQSVLTKPLESLRMGSGCRADGLERVRLQYHGGAEVNDTLLLNEDEQTTLRLHAAWTSVETCFCSAEK
ncbi:hypothetical protein KUCAC02_027797 [Chaenocephalus aceratus]|nr:hypothetical protein KUCAC02_027797 [Chaenocephalus aceratus]